VTISVCDDIKSQQVTEHLMQNENILLFEIQRIFFSFNTLFFFSGGKVFFDKDFFFFPFSGGKMVLIKGQCYVRSIH